MAGYKRTAVASNPFVAEKVITSNHPVQRFAQHDRVAVHIREKSEWTSLGSNISPPKICRANLVSAP